MIFNYKTWKGYHSIRRHILEFAIAWLLFTCVVLTYNYIKWLERESAPVSEYFIVRQISVPNFAMGTNPVIIYDRTINKNFRGHYTVEVQKSGTLQPLLECTGSFDVNYTPEKHLPEGGATLFWFIGHECDIPAGAYRLEACWDIYRENASTKHYCAQSELFNVYDPDQPAVQQQSAPNQ